MIVLDTDHFMILQTGKGLAFNALSSRIDASVDQDFVTTVITFEEHMRGWLATIRSARESQIRFIRTIN